MRYIVSLAIIMILSFPFNGFTGEIPFHGFLETSVGARVVDDVTSPDDILLEEARFQLDFIRDGDLGSLAFRTDFLYDGVDDGARIEIREANILFTPSESMDIKVGRQILTWGTGDLIFLNDLFPKDWRSFFIGRDDEYLKKPADLVRATWFGDRLNLDLAWFPVFSPDTFISGERISFWDFSKGRRVGPADGVTKSVEPDKKLGNSQIAGRLYGNFGGWETALYGYRGHFGQPVKFDSINQRFTFPRLEAWGASARGNLFSGIGNVEVSWYRSMDDLSGDDPNVPNSQFRLLVGYTHEVATDQTMGFQAYLERALDFPDTGRLEQNRWWLTIRYTGLFMQQNLIISWFNFFSPNEGDAFLRPKASYKISDEILFTLGGNMFLGRRGDTFFGQFKDNTNLYARIRYSF